MRWSVPRLPIGSSRFVKSAVAPLTVTADTVAFGLIRKDSVEAGDEETFLIVRFALTVKLRSLSADGSVAAMSYLSTCQVAMARVSSPRRDKIRKSTDRKNKKQQSCEFHLCMCAFGLGNDRVDFL